VTAEFVISAYHPLFEISVVLKRVTPGSSARRTIACAT